MNDKLLVSMLTIGLLVMCTLTIQSKELKVGIAELDYPPYYFVKDGVFNGAAVEVAQYIATKLGHTLVFKRYPWKRVQSSLRSGTIDMVIHYFKTPEREKDAVFTNTPHVYEASYLIVANGAKIPYTGTLNSLESYKFGHIDGYYHGKEYLNAEYLHKTTVSNEESLIKMLVRGRFDIAVGNKETITKYAAQDGVRNKISVLTPPIDEGPNFLAFSIALKDSEKLAEAFSVEIIKFKTTEIYRDILEKYELGILEIGVDATQTND